MQIRYNARCTDRNYCTVVISSTPAGRVPPGYSYQFCLWSAERRKIMLCSFVCVSSVAMSLAPSALTTQYYHVSAVMFITGPS